MERPPILQWKVSLALLAVVIGAVTLGSALRGDPSVRHFYVSGLNSGNTLITIGNPGASKFCAQGRVRGRMYHVLGYKQSQFRFSNYVPSPVPPEFLAGPCPGRRNGPKP
jgi:hypothetical protein